MWGKPGARSRGRSFGKPRARARRATTGRAPVALLPSPLLPARLRGCPGATGLSRRCLPTQLPMLAPQPAPMHGRRRAGQLLRAPAPDGGVWGQRLLPPLIDCSPISPGVSLCPSAGFATNFAVAGRGREGGGRLPSTVPGGRARGARDGALPGNSSAEGAERGGGHRRSYTRLAQDSQLGPAPRSLSLTCLTPPQPSPAPLLAADSRCPRRHRPPQVRM